MQQKFKDWLIAYCEEHGYGTSDDDLMETIIDCGKFISSEIVSEHRWYQDEEIVVQLEDKFVSYMTYNITGDNSMSDMGLEHNIDYFEEVEPYETTVTKYRFKNQ